MVTTLGPCAAATKNKIGAGHTRALTTQAGHCGTETQDTYQSVGPVTVTLEVS